MILKELDFFISISFRTIAPEKNCLPTLTQSLNLTGGQFLLWAIILTSFLPLQNFYSILNNLIWKPKILPGELPLIPSRQIRFTLVWDLVLRCSYTMRYQPFQSRIGHSTKESSFPFRISSVNVTKSAVSFFLQWVDAYVFVEFMGLL